MKRLLALASVTFLFVACSDKRAQSTAPSSVSLAAAATSASAGVVLDVPRDYSTIQDAVNAASAGSIVQVRAGTYNENVVITTPGLRLHASTGVVVKGPGSGIGIYVHGTSAKPVADVEISGFEVTNFERGIIIEGVTGASIHHNDAHHNRNIGGVTLGDGTGIELVTTHQSDVTENSVYGNSEGGIQLRVGSTGNTVRGNRVYENGDIGRLPHGNGILITGAGTNDNRIVANDVVGNYDRGILITRPAGTVPITGNEVSENRVHGNQRSGIAIMVAAIDNFVLQNDARDNNLSGLAPCFHCNLMDLTSPGIGANTWERNLGTFNLRDDCAK